MSRSIPNPGTQQEAAQTRTVMHPSPAGLPTREAEAPREGEAPAELQPPREGEAPAEFQPPREGEAPAELQPQVGQLLAVLSTLHELLKRLLELARAKVNAMRAADAVALQRCAAEECGILERLFEQEDQRNAALARLAQSLHCHDVAPVPLPEIAERLPEPLSSRLRARTAGLRRTADELRQKNRLAAEVARHLHDHIRAVFEDVARVNQESVVYGPSGKHEQRTNQPWVDAVG